VDEALKACGLSLLASLGTGLGGSLAVVRRPSERTAGLLMGLAAGVMITLAFVELVNEAWQSSGYLVTTLGFALGALVMFLVDWLTPHIRFAEDEERSASDAHMLKTGLLMAIGISIHNIPEGMAVGAGYVHQPAFGVFIALAIALHNIPEGIATALPLYEGGMAKWKAAGISLLSGLVEPLGALFAAIFLTAFAGLVAAALAFAAGVMVFITLDDLDGEQVQAVKVVANPYFPNHEPGQVPAFVHSQGVDAMLTGGMGGRAAMFFEQYGIRPVTGASGTVRQALESYQRGDLGGWAPCSDSVAHGHGGDHGHAGNC
jgi:zinc transporter, ZIP family